MTAPLFNHKTNFKSSKIDLNAKSRKSMSLLQFTLKKSIFNRFSAKKWVIGKRRRKMLRRKVVKLVKLNRTETSRRNEQVLWNENNFVWSSEVMNLVSSPQNLTLIQRLTYLTTTTISVWILTFLTTPMHTYDINRLKSIPHTKKIIKTKF